MEDFSGLAPSEGSFRRMLIGLGRDASLENLDSWVVCCLFVQSWCWRLRFNQKITRLSAVASLPQDFLKVLRTLGPSFSLAASRPKDSPFSTHPYPARDGLYNKGESHQLTLVDEKICRPWLLIFCEIMTNVFAGVRKKIAVNVRDAIKKKKR